MGGPVGLHNQGRALVRRKEIDMIKPGYWWLSSENDPRWNQNGTGLVGGFAIPAKCETAIEELKKEYGEPPEDLEWGSMKD